MTKTLATLFTGGGGFDIGAHQAGLQPIWGVEIEPDVAGYAELNNPGLTVIRQGVETVDYTSLERPYWLHASPVCKRASIASQGDECDLDIETANGVIKAIAILQPVVFSLENVWMYRNFRAFNDIVTSLVNNSYAVDWWHLNSANFGVPQTRKRLILIARRDGLRATRPQATHGKLTEQPTLFETVKPWCGWFQAIEDLLPGLPDSEFAPWQLDRLPEDYKPFLVGQGERNQPKFDYQPADTVTSNSNQTGVKAFLVMTGNTNRNGNDNKPGRGVCHIDEPANIVMPGLSGGMPKAFIVDCQKNGSPSSNNGKRGLTIRGNGEPMFTVTAGRNKRTVRAWLSQGRVVSMTPRSLARFQAVPDSYKLPDNRSLACRIVGNMVPPLWAQRITESVLKSTTSVLEPGE